MNLKHCFKIRSVISCCLFFHALSYGQTFQRSEISAGFGVLEENSGVAVADYDADNDLDIFVVAHNVEQEGNSKTFSRLFRNNNDGTFTDVTEASGLINLLTQEDLTDNTFAQVGHKFGVSWGDFNNDGFPDILFTNALKLQLFINIGNGTFADVTPITGLNEVNNCIITGATWFDYNNDGLLDIYISDWDACDTNSLFRNNGNTTFTNVTESLGLVEPDTRASYTSFPFDVNNDGWMDLMVANDFDKANYLYINQSGTGFTEEAQSYGLDSMIDDMGIAINDFDNDNDFDFFITGIDTNALLVNNGSNNFTEASATYNLTETGWAWGTRFADFDLDGDEDAVVVNGYDFEDRNLETNTYFKNLHIEGQNSFENVSEAVGFADETISVEVVDFDYDNDGDLDLFVTNNNGPSYFYENKLLNFDETSSLKWFKVALQGTVSNRDAIGTKLELTTSNGTLLRYHSGVGFFGQSLQAIHFGLQTESTITTLKIIWPSGLEEIHENLEVNTIIKAIEGQGYEVLDIIPSQKIYGCTDSDSCNYNPEATLEDGSCEYLPSNEISGNTTSGFLRTEIYSYPIANGSTASWSVQGGDLLEGQGTNEISVKWHITESGTVNVRETSNECSGLEISLNVIINVSEINEDTSIARVWNEALLEAIRSDFARPTVHARNLFHTSIAMYDAWAIYDEQAEPYFMGNTVHGFESQLEEFIAIENVEDSRKKAISYAAYRLLSHRFQNSPNAEETQAKFNLIMEQLGYDTAFEVGTNYQFGNAAALGNYIAQTIISYGNQDGAREASGYDNAYYEPFNEALVPVTPGNPLIQDPNRWQPLSLDGFVDQSGNPIPGTVIDFLSPEWGNVTGFATTSDAITTYVRDGNTYKVINDPQEPPYLEDSAQTESSEAYKWGFSMVSVWGSHLDAHDGVMIDISPKSIGNIDFNNFPENYNQYPDFYNFFNGGDISPGHEVNPITNQAYQEQIIPRGDYVRVLAEFWADGPDSETPPGHWFTILNYVNENPLFEKRFAGQGDVLSPLEWDVKAYFILSGAMHDSAISSWSIKGWYDYIRPISAIRYLAEKGQSTDASLPNYHIEGIPLFEGYIELVRSDDPLSGSFDQNVDKIKLFTWRGHDFIGDTETDEAGVGWILAENWWPYQRPNFVTPPFAGYVSGHSTYSRAAAEVMTSITGSAFFPGGLGEFEANQNEFLVFEEGPSMDVTLQWATYRDASDQCSLSRIWGGIHPPADDIPGRIIGEKIGKEAYNFAVPYFNGQESVLSNQERVIYPNPVVSRQVNVTNSSISDRFEVFDIRGRKVEIADTSFNQLSHVVTLTFPNTMAAGLYMLSINNDAVMIILGD